MILCPACVRLYHGQSASLAPKGAVVLCEACGEPLQARRTDARRHLTAIFGCLALVLAISVVGGRSAIVALLPNAASMFSTLGLTEGADGLRIEHVHVGLSREGDRSLLVVEGDIVNALTKSADIPELAVSLDDSSGIELYSWRAHAPKTRIAPSERLAFRTRLESPPPEASQALVKFAAVGDKVALAGKGQ